MPIHRVVADRSLVTVRARLGRLAQRPTLRTMEAEQLVRRLRRLKRTLEQLEAEFAHHHIDAGLLTDIDRMVENDLATEPQAAHLIGLLEQLRENTLTPRAERYTDGIRDCRRLKAAIEEVIAEVG